MRVCYDARRGPFFFEYIHDALQWAASRGLAKSIIYFLYRAIFFSDEIELGDAARTRGHTVSLPRYLKVFPDKPKRFSSAGRGGDDIFCGSPGVAPVLHRLGRQRLGVRIGMYSGE